MKKVFIGIRQWILRHRKRLIYGAMAFFIGQICFFGLNGIGIENEVFAAAGGESQTQSQSLDEAVTKKYQELTYIQKIIYSLIYPFLVIAGTLVDNSLVYGETFHFDVVLWNLWNIMRNFANFTLGFIFIYKIFKYLVGGKKGNDIKTFLIRLLLAGIGIQVSWFAMAALIDVSTILTYGIGGLPITILQNESNTKDEGESNSYDPYILKTIVNIDVEDIDKVHMYLTNTEGDHIYIAECETINKEGHELLLAPSLIYYMDNKEEGPKPTINKGCHYGGQVYYFNQLYDGIQFPEEKLTNENYVTNQQKYRETLSNAERDIGKLSGDDVKAKIENAILLEKGNAHVEGGVWGALRPGTYTKDERGLDVDNKITGEGKTLRLHEILTGSSYVGVFTQLYSSLLHSGEGIITRDGTELSKLLGMALSLGHLIAIGIPLIVAGLVFMIRIGILWMAIILSPFIAILTAFDDIGDHIFKKLDFLEYFRLKNLILVIFSPAIVCLAVSLSTVLFKIISNLGTTSTDGSGWREFLGGMIKLNIGGISTGIRDFMLSILGIAITWFLVRTAVKLSKIGKMPIIKSLEGLAKSSLGSIPIVPIPGKDGKGVDFIGANTAFGLDGREGIISQIKSNFISEYNKADNAAVNAWINPKGAKETAASNAKSNRLNKYIEALTATGVEKITPDWQNTISIPSNDVLGDNPENTTFAHITSESDKQRVIEAINGISDEEKRKQFGSVSPTIDGKREFNSRKNKYERRTENPSSDS